MRRLRVSYLLELVAAVAVGLGLARLFFLERYPGVDMVGAALTGIALVEGVAVWWEAARRRGPAAWGFGRVTWSIAGGVSLLYVISETLFLDMLQDSAWDPEAGLLRTLLWDVWFHISYPIWWLLPWCLPAIFLTLRLGGCPRDPNPDGREWAGRLYAILVVALFFASYGFGLFDLDWIARN